MKKSRRVFVNSKGDLCISISVFPNIDTLCPYRLIVGSNEFKGLETSFKIYNSWI